jgi:hypothetical protein
VSLNSIDPADENEVIAGIDALLQRAHENRDRTGEHWNAVRAFSPVDSIEAIRLRRTRETDRHFLLILTEHIDGKWQARAQAGHETSAFVDAHQH